MHWLDVPEPREVHIHPCLPPGYPSAPHTRLLLPRVVVVGPPLLLPLLHWYYAVVIAVPGACSLRPWGFVGNHFRCAAGLGETHLHPCHLAKGCPPVYLVLMSILSIQMKLALIGIIPRERTKEGLI